MFHYLPCEYFMQTVMTILNLSKLDKMKILNAHLEKTSNTNADNWSSCLETRQKENHKHLVKPRLKTFLLECRYKKLNHKKKNIWVLLNDWQWRIPRQLLSMMELGKRHFPSFNRGIPKAFLLFIFPGSQKYALLYLMFLVEILVSSPCYRKGVVETIFKLMWFRLSIVSLHAIKLHWLIKSISI